MSIELNWDDDGQTVMRCDFSAEWTWDELFTALEQVRQVASGREDQIGAIIDVSSGAGIPGGALGADALKYAQDMLAVGAEEQRGPVVVTGASAFLKSLYGMLAALDAKATADVYFADTLGEAREIMRRRMEAGGALPS
jgi:hypothetical protein